MSERSGTQDTFEPASSDDVCANCSRTRAEHKSSICVTGGFCKFPVKQTKATFEVVEAAFPTRFRAIIDTPGVVDEAYRSDFERAVQLIERQRDEIERLRGLLDCIAAVVVGGAGQRRICDGPGAFAPEAGPTYDEIYRAHSEIEKLTDER